MAAALVPQISTVQVSSGRRAGSSEVPCGPTSEGLLGCRWHRESSSACLVQCAFTGYHLHLLHCTHHLHLAAGRRALAPASTS